MVLADLVIGAFSTLALPPVCFVPALAVGLLYLYRCIDDASGARERGIHAFFFGLGYHTAALSWLTNAILTRAHDFWWAVPIAAPGCALILAPFIMVPVLVAALVPAGIARMGLFAASWTLADMARVFIFTGFPWNPTGSTLELPGLAGDILIQPAALIGVDGLGFLVVFFGLLVWHGHRARVAVALGLLAWGAGGWFRLDHPDLLPVVNPEVALIQGDIREQDILSREGAIEAFRLYLRLTAEGVAKAREDAPDRNVVYLWPESGFPGLLDEDEAARNLIARAADGSWGMIGSDRRDAQGRFYNSIMALDESGRVRATYDKATLVPFGEYQPRFIPFNLLPEQLTPGKGLETWTLPALGSVGPMVCYEIIFSGHVTGKKRPDWLANITNDAWFGNSAGPRQHLATVRMRAVEEGLPVVQAANMGITAAFDSSGHELARLPWGKPDSLVLSVPPPRVPTVFSRLGRIVPFSLCMVVVLVTVSLGRRRRMIIEG
ncbi:apolipoprotein N-acyltransferase [Swaminathania salitolerans]|uniref:Apolipoprotein N-acyltransferase n=1 Tax=Swaminathania salitolerans TaxID=182838 RepID=A0A511BQM0_9PROT|nr:apolipoprotein N-acyltransferase [Swaminathania salitolerans]GBQ11862.1 apolipoprotein N-acyltransferase [Swaminathania salitolerans LMG 21291]GEL02647.1 apolipoprotein N-acyltransferase [Swaminathania salitolerans]